METIKTQVQLEIETCKRKKEIAEKRVNELEQTNREEANEVRALVRNHNEKQKDFDLLLRNTGTEACHAKCAFIKIRIKGTAEQIADAEINYIKAVNDRNCNENLINGERQTEIAEYNANRNDLRLKYISKRTAINAKYNDLLQEISIEHTKGCELYVEWKKKQEKLEKLEEEKKIEK